MFNYACIGLIGSALLLLASGEHRCRCNRKHAPVCARAEDGSRQDYTNRCLAECDGHSTSNVIGGECTACACTLEWNPVCASNGVIFGNECVMGCSGFVRGDDNQCPHISQLPQPAVKRSYLCQAPSACQMIYQVVCDGNGNSYANKCIANCAGLDENDVSEELCLTRRLFLEK
jgi:hypothetical protein